MLASGVLMHLSAQSVTVLTLLTLQEGGLWRPRNLVREENSDEKKHCLLKYSLFEFTPSICYVIGITAICIMRIDVEIVWLPVTIWTIFFRSDLMTWAVAFRIAVKADTRPARHHLSHNMPRILHIRWQWIWPWRTAFRCLRTHEKDEFPMQRLLQLVSQLKRDRLQPPLFCFLSPLLLRKTRSQALPVL